MKNRKWTRYLNNKELKALAKAPRSDNPQSYAFTVGAEVERELTRRKKKRS